MSVAQSIGWCDETLNPIRGCTTRCWGDSKHPEGNCYAAEIARRRMGDCPRCHDHLDVHLHAERLEQPLRWKKPRRIFLGSMTDLWDPDVKPEWRQAIWKTCAETARHTYIVLTKQPQRIDWSELASGWELPNLIVGTSVTGYEDNWRVEALRGRHHAHKLKCFGRTPRYLGRLAVSFEPLLGDVRGCVISGLDWVIIGAASGAVARMYPQERETLAPIIEGIVTMADVLGTPVFVKDNAEPFLPEGIGKRYRKWPE